MSGLTNNNKWSTARNSIKKEQEVDKEIDKEIDKE